MSPAKVDHRGSLVPTDAASRLALEAEADELIYAVTRETTKHSDKADILTPWKDAARRRREIFVISGTPERALRMGSFHRVYNRQQVWLNSSDQMASGIIRHGGHKNPYEGPGRSGRRGMGNHYLPQYPIWRIKDDKEWPVVIRHLDHPVEDGESPPE